MPSRDAERHVHGDEGLEGLCRPIEQAHAMARHDAVDQELFVDVEADLFPAFESIERRNPPPIGSEPLIGLPECPGFQGFFFRRRWPESWAIRSERDVTRRATRR
jgi:hypothetical protein